MRITSRSLTRHRRANRTADTVPMLVDQAIILAHIGAGSLALLTALLALVAAKGSRLHRLAGRSHVIVMFLVFASATWLAMEAPRPALLMLGVLAFYLTLSGWRSLHLKRPPKGPFDPMRPDALDKGAVQFTSIAGGATVAMAFVNYRSDPTTSIIMGVLGVLGIVIALRDMRRFRSQHLEPNDWLLRHMTRMSAGLALALTAIAVVNLPDQPLIVRWLVPGIAVSVVMGPRIYLVQRKLASGAEPGEIYAVSIGEEEA
ncbi:MAG: hypothetical protein HOL85_03030 [Rhodospirillaceae bacterium]|nr:hypothetical protein [Rhodospirillaceae bacterium]